MAVSFLPGTVVPGRVTSRGFLGVWARPPPRVCGGGRGSTRAEGVKRNALVREFRGLHAAPSLK